MYGEVAAVAIPFGGNSESGDVVGATHAANGLLAWVIDVEGKGAMAEPAASALHRVASAYGALGTTNPTTVLSALHECCVSCRTRAAATVLFMAGNTVTLGVAGVQPPFVVDGDTGALTVVDADGMTLGFPFTPTFATGRIELAPGVIVVAGSDGLYEAEDRNGQLLDLHQLGRALKGHTEVSIASNLIRVLDAVHEHSPRPMDDLSVMMLRGSDLPLNSTVALAVRPRIPSRRQAQTIEHAHDTTATELCVVAG